MSRPTPLLPGLLDMASELVAEADNGYVPETGAVVLARTILDRVDRQIHVEIGPVYFNHCPSDDPSECSLIRERSVAGISDDVPACPVHGAFVEGA